jgi:hypothetical protein
MERLLEHTGRGNSICRSSEDSKAAISLTPGPHNDALEPRDACFYQRIVADQGLAHRVGVTFPQLRAALDIGEKEGESPTRQARIGLGARCMLWGSDDCRRSASKSSTQQVDQRRVGTGAILREASALEQQETPCRCIGFRLGDQARFADSSLASDQHYLHMAVTRAIDMLVKVIEL